MRSKVNIVSGSWMYVTHHLMGIDPCAKYGKPMPKEKKKLRADHEDMSKTLQIFFILNFTLRSKVNSISGSLMYATHNLMVLHPCAKYMVSQCQSKKINKCTDRRRDRQSNSPSHWITFTGCIMITELWFESPFSYSTLIDACAGQW